MVEDIKIQERVILAFLKTVVQRAKKETGIKGMEYSIEYPEDDDPDDPNVYIITNESLDPGMILEVNINKANKRQQDEDGIIVYIYNCYHKLFFGIVSKELIITAKKLKIKDWEIVY